MNATYVAAYGSFYLGSIGINKMMMCALLLSGLSPRNEKGLPVWSLLGFSTGVNQQNLNTWIQLFKLTFPLIKLLKLRLLCLHPIWLIYLHGFRSILFENTQTGRDADRTLHAWRCWNQPGYFWFQSDFRKTSGFEVAIFAFDPQGTAVICFPNCCSKALQIP